ncbi:hypothetical protein QYM36_019811 [Artemia franciscana]|uniref:Uncharacterized protein n=1 Tax=Artemia franciscana TaxID=6661 RepID=A0AA88H0S8_ARTSF|nr:hypothetical protein QYM36_019811 [Artemia franciscana]
MRDWRAVSNIKSLENFSKICANFSDLDEDSLRILKYLKDAGLGAFKYGNTKQLKKSSSSKYEKHKHKKEICKHSKILESYHKKLQDNLREGIDNFLRGVKKTDTYFKLNNTDKYDQQLDETKTRFVYGQETISDKTKFEELTDETKPVRMSEHSFQNGVEEKMSGADLQGQEIAEGRSSIQKSKSEDKFLDGSKSSLQNNTTANNEIPQKIENITKINHDENLGANKEETLAIGSTKKNIFGNQKEGYVLKLTNIWYTNIEIAGSVKKTIWLGIVLLVVKLINPILKTFIASYFRSNKKKNSND